jgi:GTP cyclohydrolase II
MTRDSSIVPTHKPAALGEVRRAIDRFRRGDAVVIAHQGSLVLAFAAETLVEPTLADAQAQVQELLLVTTGYRASALGLGASPSQPAIIRLPHRPTLAQIRAVTDPTTRAGQLAPIGTVQAEDEAHRPFVAASITLTKLAGLMPASVIGDIAAVPQGIPVVTSGDIIDFSQNSARWLDRVAEARMPLAASEKTHIVAFRPYDGGPEALAIVIGDYDAAKPVLTRIHSACFTGDLLGSLRCDCGDQLRGAIEIIAAAGGGVVVYLPQEGRGIGLVNKLRAYALQDSGLDTFDANQHLGFQPDERSYAMAGEILRQLGISRIRLLTNNPEKIDAIASLGCEVVERVPLAFDANPHNRDYLLAKARRSSHNL